MAEELHVLFGGGQVGHPLSRILLGCGKRVRIVKRSAGGLSEGVEFAQGDATDTSFCVHLRITGTLIRDCRREITPTCTGGVLN
jgi:nucleoside-diphosphate-sugar epimerase